MYRRTGLREFQLSVAERLRTAATSKQALSSKLGFQVGADNWFVALLTLGEGYHSFHHKFPADYRNGIRWYDWDPAKWWIAALHYAGLAKGLLVTPLPQIEQARLRAALRLVEPRIASSAPAGSTPDRRPASWPTSPASRSTSPTPPRTGSGAAAT